MNQEVSSSVPPQPSIKPAPSTFPGWMIGLMFLGVGLVGGLMVGKYVYTPKSIPPPIVDVSPTPTSDPTANWKTYTNSRYSFRYPQTWETQPIPSGTQQAILLLSPDKFMSLSLSLDLQGLGYECITKTKEETITIDAQKVTKTTFMGAINDMCGDNTKQRDVWISIPRENKIDHLTFSTDEKNLDKAMEIFDQILSTFKFLEGGPTASSTSYSAPSNWKRFTTQTGLNLCLPSKWESDSYGTLVFKRDASYQPRITTLETIPYSGGSRRDAYFQYWESEYPNVRQLVSVSETSINNSTVLTIYPTSTAEESKTSPEGLAVVWYTNGKLWKAGLSQWAMINDSQSAFLKDFYTMISCSY